MDVWGALTLRPGDRRIRAVVGRVPPAGDPWWVERSCARCSGATDVHSGALVVYGPHDSTTPATAALCASCAALLTPLRFAVDLDRIRAIDDPDGSCSAVGEFVERVLVMRAEPPAGLVWTRARDTHVLAQRLGVPQTDLVLRLRDRSVLSAVEVATKDRPGTARRGRQPHRISA